MTQLIKSKQTSADSQFSVCFSLVLSFWKPQLPQRLSLSWCCVTESKITKQKTKISEFEKMKLTVTYYEIKHLCGILLDRNFWLRWGNQRAHWMMVVCCLSPWFTNLSHFEAFEAIFQPSHALLTSLTWIFVFLLTSKLVYLNREKWIKSSKAVLPIFKKEEYSSNFYLLMCLRNIL